MELRPHQDLAIQMCRESFARGNKRIMLAAPTSFGKTITAISMLVSAAQKGKRAIFICDRVKLIDQTVEACERYGIDVGVMQGDHWMTDHRKQIQIASIQTLSRRFRMAEFDFAVVDEAHTHYAYLTKMMEAYSAVPFIGLSATPYSKGLGQHYQDLIVPITPRELLDQSYLCPVRYYGGREIDTKGLAGRALTTGGTDYDPKALGKRAEDDQQLTGDIIKNWFKWGENSQTIAFSPSIKHSKYMVDMFREHGVAAEHIDGYMEPDERQILFDAHDAGEFKILSCSRLLNTGYDAPGVRCLIDAFPTRSLISYQQRVGRLMRTMEGKEYAIYLDHAGNVNRHGFAEDLVPVELDDGEGQFKERNQVEKEKKETKVKDCPKCFQKMVGLKCVCGYEVPMRERLESDDTELVELTAQKKVNKEWTRAEKERFLGELLFYGKTRGYKAGWAANKYREKTGVWPNKIDPAPAYEVSESTMGWLKHKQIAWAKRRERVA